MTNSGSSGEEPPLPRIRPAVLEVLLYAQKIGAIGPAPIEQHIEHSLGFARAVGALARTPSRLLDLGSGGGIPGLILAEVFPDSEIVLLDGRSARCELLRAALRQLEFGPRVLVLEGRAEELARSPRLRSSFDVAVARGFAAPGVTAECGAPFLRLGGVLCVSEPPDSVTEQRWPRQGCVELGLRVEHTVVDPFGFVLLQALEVCPEQYPRRVGIPAKRPLF